MAVVNLTGSGGLNLAAPSTQIANNELTAAYNMVFEPQSGKLVTREGLSLVKVQKFDKPINYLYTHVRKHEEAWLIAVVDSSLYTLSLGATLVDVNGDTLVDSDGRTLVIGSESWTLLAHIESNSPTMISFNGSLVVADGSDQGLLKWDGTTVSRISDSPQATTVFTMKNFVIANNIAEGELDAVYFSKREDENVWDITAGAAGIRAGFGDGMQVNAFAALSDTLVVSKIATDNNNVVRKKMFAVDISGQQADWSARDLSENNSALNQYSFVGINQDIMYLDSEGIERLRPVQEYGDIANDPVSGGKINAYLTNFLRQVEDARLIAIPELASVWVVLRKENSYYKSFAYSTSTEGYTELAFSTPIYAVEKFADRIYLAGESGYLYYLDNVSNDEIEPGVFVDYTSVVAFKQIRGDGLLALQKTIPEIEFLADGEYWVEATDGRNNNKRPLHMETFTAENANKFLHDAEEYLHDATYSLSGNLANRVIRSRFVGNGITLQIRTKSGRIGVNGVSANIEQVGM